MKHKQSKKITQAENIHQWRKNFLLGKRQAARTQLKETREAQRREIFEERTSRATDKKAPVTLRTRAYYRFAKDYPSIVDENGFRDNSPSKKSVKKRRILTLILCVIVFSLAYIFAHTCQLISAEPIETTAKATQTDAVTTKALHFTYEELKAGNTEEMAAVLKANECKAAVFEFKDDSGYVLFNIGSFTGKSADRRIKDAYNTVDALKALGYEVWAYISCYKDSAASSADLNCSVRNSTSEGGAWLDNSGMGYLNPFSEDANDYILDIIKKASEKGFDRIILGNVCFSSDSGTAQQYYQYENDSTFSRNQVLLDFIGSAVKNSGSSKVTVMCDYTAFDPTADGNTQRYHGNLLSCTASSMCVDTRLSAQQKNITIGEKSFSDASLMPYVFVLTAGEYAYSGLKYSENEDKELLLCVENNDSLEDELEAVYYSGATGVIIW